MCLECNSSIFNDNYFLQSDSTAQGPQMSCSYSDIAIQYFDVKALEYTPATIFWKRFRDDIFIVWPYSIYKRHIFFDCMNKVDPTKQIPSTMGVATDTLEFLDLKLKFDKESKQMCLLKTPTVLHMFSLVRVFLKITLKTSLKMLLNILEGFAILMTHLKCVVQNIKTI